MSLLGAFVAFAQPEVTDARTSQTVQLAPAGSGQSGGDVRRAAQDVSALSLQLANVGRSAEAVTAQQAMVDVLAGFTPAVPDRLDFLLLLAEGRQALMERLIANARVEQAAALTNQTIADFRNYTAKSGADVRRAAGDLSVLSVHLTAVGRSAEAASAAQVAAGLADSRGLLANPGFTSAPVKAIYFFPGETRDPTLYTTHPKNPVDQHWLTNPASRPGVIDRIVALHANTLVLSYWSNMPQWAPMDPGPNPLQDVIRAVAGKPILIMPALESGADPNDPDIPHWEFHADFPYGTSPASSATLAPGLLLRIRTLIAAFTAENGMAQWAQIIDRNGVPRHAIHIIHAYADRIPPVAGKSADQVFADAFQRVSDEINLTDHVLIGFTLDLIPGPSGTYAATPAKAGQTLEGTPAVLAAQGYASEVFSNKFRNGPPNGAPFDNNKDNLFALVDWKSAAVHDWVATRLPVIYDVSSGFDGRFIWKILGSGFWGDNLDYTEDRWRNALSQFKGNGIVGITFNTWNGYTEGYAAAPSLEHGTTINDWVRDLYDPDPRICSHMQYADGHATHRVFGAICEKWVSLGGDRGLLGPPISDEMPSTKGRISKFTAGMILWSSATGAHEVHGLIRDSYVREGLDAGCLGLPTSDEVQANGSNGRITNFQGGVITWKPGDVQAIVRCR